MLTVEGKKKKLRRAHFEQLGKGMELTDRQIQASFNRMIRNKTKALDWIGRSFLSEPMKNLYRETLEARYQQLDLSGTK